MESLALLEKLTVLDFMSCDMGLYLNTHPKDNDAAEKYNYVVGEAKKVRNEYEKQCGPLVSFRCEEKTGHGRSWKDCPWPWEEEFNFKLGGAR